MTGIYCSGKQRISLSTNFPVHVNEGKLVDKEVLCIPLNLPLAYHMHAGNLEDKGKIIIIIKIKIIIIISNNMT